MMIPGFSTRKIASFDSLGERLKKAREEKGVSLVEAEGATKVRAKFLAALENGNWEILPQRVYTRGFLLAYIRFLSLSFQKTIPLFEHEANNFALKESRSLVYNQSIRENRVLITPKLLAYSAVSLFVVLMFSYIIYQVAGFTGSPELKIIKPNNNILVEIDTVELEGLTDNDSFITINDERVPVTGEGKFALPLKLHRGVNVISIRATNKAKKESTATYTIEYQPKTAAASENRLDNSF
ncbi:MAG: helix-turn-helix domain-containing protein [Patescibacteria group bacterium]